MQKHDDTVQNLHGDVIVGAQVQVMLAGTNTPATVFSDAAALYSVDPQTDRLGRFEFYAPNGRYDIYVVINGIRVAHETDVLIYDPEDDQRVTNGGGGGGGGGTGAAGASEIIVASTASAELDKIDGANGNMFRITLDGPLALPPVKNAQPGQRYTFLLVQDNTGGRVITTNKKYRFESNIVPKWSTSSQNIDKLVADYSGLGFFFCEARVGYSVSALARIGTVRYETMATGISALQTTQTLYITRNGLLAEALATMNTAGVFTVAGAPEYPGIPQLHMDKTIRASWGKGILDVEQGDVTIRDLWFDGAVNDVDETISGVRYNGGVTKLTMIRVKTTNCNNGQLAGVVQAADTAPVGQYNIEHIDCEFNGNGLAYQPSEVGQSHNIYLNHGIRYHGLRCKFINAVEGHDFKTRANSVLLDRCQHEGARHARELDVPNGGVIHAVNCIFRKQPGASQGNLIGIGLEGNLNAEQEYIFRNCVLDNSQGANFSETWIIQQNASVPVKFVDCVFIGAPKTVMVTPFELYYTGGPIGPEGWDQTVRGVTPKLGITDSMNGNSFSPDADQPVPQTVSVDPTLTAFPATGSSATPSVRDDMGAAI